MNQKHLKKIINYITDQGIKAIKENTKESLFQIDYLAIFARNKTEYQELLKLIDGQKINAQGSKTGLTFLLTKPIKTLAGSLKFLKIRKPDPTRPQRGAPDFKLKNYSEFKKTYLSKSGNFTLMIRKNYEMIELKGADVLVYFPNKSIEIR